MSCWIFQIGNLLDIWDDRCKDLIRGWGQQCPVPEKPSVDSKSGQEVCWFCKSRHYQNPGYQVSRVRAQVSITSLVQSRAEQSDNFLVSTVFCSTRRAAEMSGSCQVLTMMLGLSKWRSRLVQSGGSSRCKFLTSGWRVRVRSYCRRPSQCQGEKGSRKERHCRRWEEFACWIYHENISALQTFNVIIQKGLKDCNLEAGTTVLVRIVSVAYTAGVPNIIGDLVSVQVSLSFL